MPPELARRLAATGIAADDAAPAIAVTLLPGQRLVTREGRLWRWDGFRAFGGQGVAAAERLTRRNRLAALARFSSVGDAAHDDGLATRPVLWRAALAMWARDPGLGVGAGNFELLTPTVGLVGVRTHANSLYLQSLAEGGVPLVTAVLWTLGAVFAAAFAAARSSPLAAGIAGATAALALHQVVDDLTFFPGVGGFWWALAGIAVASGTLPRFRPAAGDETA